MMARHQTSQAVLEHFDLPITLCSKDGTISHTFPSEVVSSMRHLENTLVYRNTIPKTIAMVSALSGEGVTFSVVVIGNYVDQAFNGANPGKSHVLQRPSILFRPRITLP